MLDTKVNTALTNLETKVNTILSNLGPVDGRATPIEEEEEDGEGSGGDTQSDHGMARTKH